MPEGGVRGVHPAIVFARVRNTLKRKVVARLLKGAVCVKSSEVIEKKPVVESGVCAPLREAFGSRKCVQAEECEVCFLFRKNWDFCGGEESGFGYSPASNPSAGLGTGKSEVEQFE